MDSIANSIQDDSISKIDKTERNTILKRIIVILSLGLLPLMSFVSAWGSNGAIYKSSNLGPLFHITAYTGSFPMSYTEVVTTADTVNELTNSSNKEDRSYSDFVCSRVFTDNAQTVNASDAGDWVFINGDINGSNKVDFTDYNLMMQQYKKPDLVTTNCADLNGDGKVNFTDYNILMRNYKKSGDP